MAVQLNTRRQQNLSTFTLKNDFGLSAERDLLATHYGKEPADRRESKMLAAKAVYRRYTTIKFKHLLNYSITAAVTYITLHSFMSMNNKLLMKRRSFQNDLILHLQYQ
jgi:hypothetical protein